MKRSFVDCYKAGLFKVGVGEDVAFPRTASVGRPPNFRIIHTLSTATRELFRLAELLQNHAIVNRIISDNGGYEDEHVCILACEEGRTCRKWGRLRGTGVALVIWV
jgi:hypothetical protein